MVCCFLSQGPFGIAHSIPISTKSLHSMFEILVRGVWIRFAEPRSRKRLESVISVGRIQPPQSRPTLSKWQLQPKAEHNRLPDLCLGLNCQRGLFFMTRCCLCVHNILLFTNNISTNHHRLDRTTATRSRAVPNSTQPNT